MAGGCLSGAQRGDGDAERYPSPTQGDKEEVTVTATVEATGTGTEAGVTPPTPSAEGDAPKPKTKDYPPEFEAQFWEHYPKGRGSKADAFKFWSKLSREERAAIVAAFPAFQASRDWREGFHSAPEVWLKGRRWENPPPAPPEMADPTEAYMRGEITSPEQLLNFRRLAS